MATKHYQQAGTPVVKENRCDACKAGRHAERGCRGGVCTCHCTRPGVPVLPKPVPMTLRPSTENALRTLRAEGVECRATRDWQLVWKPKPADMTPPIRLIIKGYKLELVHLLFPSDDWRGPLRPFWFHGDNGVCVDENCNVIGEGITMRCTTYDPLGQCRHKSCGWINGPPPQGTVPVWLQHANQDIA